MRGHHLLLSCLVLAGCAGSHQAVVQPMRDGIYVATGQGNRSSAGLLTAQFAAMEDASRTCAVQKRRFVPLNEAVTLQNRGARTGYAVRFACVDSQGIAPAANRLAPPAPPL